MRETINQLLVIRDVRDHGLGLLLAEAVRHVLERRGDPRVIVHATSPTKHRTLHNFVCIFFDHSPAVCQQLERVRFGEDVGLAVRANIPSESRIRWE